MDQHEPTGTTNSTNTDSEISAARRILNRAGDILNDNKDKATTRAVALLAAGALTIGLAGCGANASAEGPKPTTTTSAEATPSATPSSTPEATTSPEAPAFTGTINYDKLTGPQWVELNPLEQQAVCSEFFAANIENEPTMTAFSTGTEVSQWFKNRLLLVQSLTLDKSNDLNFEAAKSIGECLTLDYITSEDESAGRKDIVGQIIGMYQSSIEGLGFTYIEPEQVTRYSDGTFPATAEHELSYAALSVEGRQNNGIGNQPGTLVMNYFQWAPDEGVYRYVLTTPTEDGGVNPYFGSLKPPVVVDPSRQNAPNTL